MTRDDIIRMAREAGDDVDHTLPSDLDFLERFAALVAATERTACARHFDVAMRNAVTVEREACAKVCDRRAQVSPVPQQRVGAARCAAAIRERGDT